MLALHAYLNRHYADEKAEFEELTVDGRYGSGYERYLVDECASNVGTRLGMIIRPGMAIRQVHISLDDAVFVPAAVKFEDVAQWLSGKSVSVCKTIHTEVNKLYKAWQDLTRYRAQLSVEQEDVRELLHVFHSGKRGAPLADIPSYLGLTPDTHAYEAVTLSITELVRKATSATAGLPTR